MEARALRSPSSSSFLLVEGRALEATPAGLAMSSSSSSCSLPSAGVMVSSAYLISAARPSASSNSVKIIVSHLDEQTSATVVARRANANLSGSRNCLGTCL
eukprot:6209259-Pleurochrysis_carterae.AAC.1